MIITLASFPYVHDSWVDESKTKVGYEISFNRYFYVYRPPRSIDEIQGELKSIEQEIEELFSEHIEVSYVK